MLGGAEGVRAIEITRRRITIGKACELETHRFGGPIDRVCVKRVGKVDQPIGACIECLCQRREHCGQ